jgi:hypothetical protein
MKIKINTQHTLLTILAFMFFALHVNAQDENTSGINKSPMQFAEQYNPDQYALNLYHSAKKEFDFNGANKNDFDNWHKAFLPRLRKALGLDKIEFQLINYTPKTERKAIDLRRYDP